MKTKVRLLLWICAITIFAGACKDDYLRNTDNAISITSAIYVSPQWSAESYPVAIPSAQNATYTLDEIPRWLNPVSKTGQFVNGVAYINCSANPDSEFQSIGIYNSTMKINVDGVGSFVMTVGYVNAGSPRIDCPQTLEAGYYGTQLNIQTNGEGILIWQIVKHPEWITLSDSAGISRYGGNSVYMSLKADKISLTNISDEIWIANNSVNNPLCIVKINFNVGDPSFSSYNDLVDFGRTDVQKNITISNHGTGLLAWTIEECPEWITVSPQQGIIQNYSDENVTLTCKRSVLSNGIYTGTIVIRSNDKNKPTYSIIVKCRNGTGNSENITAIEGTVKDAEYSKTSDMLYLVTQAPNKLLAYNTKTKEFVANINLSKAPTCVSIDDNGQTAVVGHGGTVSYIDLIGKNVLKTFNIDFTVYDIVSVNDEWCCLTPEKDQWVNLHWLNLKTGEDYLSSNSIYEKTLIKKLNNQTIIAGDNNTLMIVDINQKKIERTFYHVSSFDQFWFSADKTFLFSHSASVFRTPTLETMAEPSAIGKLQTTGYYYNNLIWLDHCPATNSLWVLESADVWNEASSNLIRYEATDYTQVKSYFYDDYYTAVDGVTSVYATSAYYVFANSGGTEIYVIKNIANQYKTNAWSMERITVE